MSEVSDDSDSPSMLSNQIEKIKRVKDSGSEVYVCGCTKNDQQHMKYNKEKVRVPKSDLIDGLLDLVLFFFFNSAQTWKTTQSSR